MKRLPAQRLRFRPHHFLCSLGFEGMGYSDAFTANMAAIVLGRLRAPGGTAALIEVTTKADDICAPCPARRGTGCQSSERIAALDAAHGAALALNEGDVLSWGEALLRMRALPPEALDDICAGCRWLEAGMCRAALTRLRLPGRQSAAPVPAALPAPAAVTPAALPPLALPPAPRSAEPDAAPAARG